MSLETLYDQKKMSAAEAVQLIPHDAVISMGMRVATPPALLTALADRLNRKELSSLKVYYMRCGDIALKTIFTEELLKSGVVKPYSSMFTKGEVQLAKKGFSENQKYIQYVPIAFSRYPGTIQRTTELDAFLVTVSPMDRFGYFNLGTNGDYAIELSRHAKKLIVEVNPNMPRTAGHTSVHLSEIHAIVENSVPLLEESMRPSTPIDHQIGAYITDLIPQGATIQMGIGGVPNAVCEKLIHHQDLGIHTEVLTAGMVDLIQKGIVTNARKTLHPHRSVFTFAIGDRALYDFIDGNPSMMCLPVSYVNEPKVIGLNDNMISVNAFVEIDFSGQVNAEFLDHQYSGVGGQLDFVRGVYYSKGGKTILASSATASNGTVSRIVPRLNTVVTDTRLDVDYIVTEFGVAQLAGKSTSERTRELIGIAAPQFREDLLQQARAQHFI